VDTDGDGFSDTAYMGDLGGNIWRFKFCTVGTASCTTASWTGRRLFNGTSVSPVRPVYTTPSVAKDGAGNLWVYWGTGDKNDPINTTYSEKIFALKDAIPKSDTETTTSPYALTNLQDVSSCGTTTCTTYDNTSTTYKGYYITLPGTGEKILSDSTVFGSILYFTTYTPPTASSTTCNQEGTASLYAISYTSGAGAFSGSGSSSRSMNIGTGIPSAPVISMRPGGSSIADLYVTVSSGFVSDGTNTGMNTGRVNFNPPGMSNRTNILYWKDMRLQ
jgi:type IV pilus assembly protein PilY1